MAVNTRNQTTLEAIFADPAPSDLRWSRVETLFRALGGTVSERKGSRIAVHLNEVVAVFHRPHPKPTTKQWAVKAVRDFLTSAGVEP